MLKNYFKIAWRNIVKGKQYAFINITGLAVGIACCLLIGLYVYQELRYDRFNKKHDRLYRVVYTLTNGQGTMKMAQTPVPLAPFLEKNIPGIEQRVRLEKKEGVVRINHHLFEEHFLVAGKAFFDMFSFHSKSGDLQQVFSSPNQVLLSTSAARKYFHSLDVIGKPIDLRIDGKYYQAQVGGIVDNPPAYSSIQFNVLVPRAFWKKVDASYKQGDNWRTLRPATYVLVRPGISVNQLASTITHTLKKQLPQYFLNQHGLFLQPITAIHFDQSVEEGLEPTANKAFVFIATGIALLILGIACINFTLLSIGHSTRRAREVGMRKAMGAIRGQLIGQFWGETLLVVLFALGLGLVLTELMLPYFNKLIGTPLTASWYSDPFLLAIIGGIVLFTGILAGSYPALYLSKFRPSQVFRNKIYVEGKHTLIHGLTTLQFALAITLIIGTLFMNRQMNFLLDNNPGYNKDQVIQMPAPFREGRSIMNGLRTRLKNESGIAQVSGSWNTLASDRIEFQSLPTSSDDKKVRAYSFGLDPRLPELLQLHITMGRMFRQNTNINTAKEVLVNKTLVKAYGWKHPIGKHISKMFSFENAEVVGVVNDFHFQSMHQKMGPLVLFPMPYVVSIYIRLKGGSLNSDLNKIQQAWKEAAPGLPFNFTFLDDQIQQQYKSDQRWANIVEAASIIAIFIACMGLFGLAVLASAKRSKELSIRKILGATVASLVGLISKDFLKPVLGGLILAVPLAYPLMRWWLANFAYKIELGAQTFIWAAVLTIGIALATVSWQSIRAALANPVDSLRSE